MKKLLKMLKDLLNGLIKSQVKVLQSEAFENKLAADIAAQIPDVPGFGDMEQKMVAKLAIDACTDKLAEAINMEAD
tara:strand:- start:2426 stop:2653 length:228 start_codon:yes stop_codon:yes gene_type:complete